MSSGRMICLPSRTIFGGSLRSGGGSRAPFTSSPPSCKTLIACPICSCVNICVFIRFIFLLVCFHFITQFYGHPDHENRWFRLVILPPEAAYQFQRRHVRAHVTVLDGHADGCHHHHVARIIKLHLGVSPRIRLAPRRRVFGHLFDLAHPTRFIAGLLAHLVSLWVVLLLVAVSVSFSRGVPPRFL